jgi:cell division protein FtsW
VNSEELKRRAGAAASLPPAPSRSGKGCLPHGVSGFEGAVSVAKDDRATATTPQVSLRDVDWFRLWRVRKGGGMNNLRSTNADATRTAAKAAAPVKQPVDKLLLILTITLIGIGIVNVFDASYATAVRTNHSEYALVIKQVRWALLGLVALIAAMRIPFWLWRKQAFGAVCLAILVLVAVFVPHVGHSLNGARRWLGAGSLELQPSEFAKLALVVYLAHVAAASGRRMRIFHLGVAPPLAIVALVCLLIAKEPDLGTAIVICGSAIVMLYVAGARRRHLIGLIGVVATAVFFYSIARPYRLHRLIAFTDPRAYQMDNGYQIWHSLIAIGSGGFAGRGLGDGIEKIFIPMAPTDMIFPVIAEEWGLIGSLVVIGLFLVVIARGYSIAHSTRDRFGSLLAAGITTLIALQSVINIAVATSSIPDTGVPLPFISYGGSALLVMMTGIGLLLNISRYPNGPERALADRPERPNEREFENRWERGHAARERRSLAPSAFSRGDQLAAGRARK